MGRAPARTSAHPRSPCCANLGGNPYGVCHVHCGDVGSARAAPRSPNRAAPGREYAWCLFSNERSKTPVRPTPTVSARRTLLVPLLSLHREQRSSRDPERRLTSTRHLQARPQRVERPKDIRAAGAAPSSRCTRDFPSASRRPLGAVGALDSPGVPDGCTRLLGNPVALPRAPDPADRSIPRPRAPISGLDKRRGRAGDLAPRRVAAAHWSSP